MFSYPKLNFRPFNFRVRRSGESVSVWDKIRGKWLVMTPEEWVRQHILAWLTEDLGVPAPLIATEYPVDLNGQPQRADIVVYTTKNKPQILVECKAPDVKLSNDVFAQAARYNAVVGACVVMISNGMEHRFYAIDGDGHYSPIASLPRFEAW